MLSSSTDATDSQYDWRGKS